MVHVSYVVTALRKDPTYINYYVNWFRLLGTGVIPMAVLIFLNVNIYCKLVETRKRRTKSKIGGANATSGAAAATAAAAAPPPARATGTAAPGSEG